MKIITRFQYQGKTIVIAELNDGQTHTFASASYPAWRGENAAGLQAVASTQAIAQPGAYVETPVHQQTMESNVRVPLATASISGVLTGTLVLCGWLFVGWPQPVTATVAATIATAWWQWKDGQGFARSLLTRVEDFTNVDWNRDGRTGSAPPPAEPVLSPFPVRVAGDDKAAEQAAVEPAPTAWVGKTTADTPIVIRHAEKNRKAYTVTLGFLWDFLQTSYKFGWTKKAWKRRGLPYEKWKDLQDFFLALNPEWWKIDNTPLLDTVLSRFCYQAGRPTDIPTDQPAENEG